MANRRQRKKNLKRALQACEKMRAHMARFDEDEVAELGIPRLLWRRLKANLEQVDTRQVMTLWREGQR